MFISYHISAKNATFCLFLAIFLFFSAGEAVARAPNDPEYQTSLWEQIGAPTAWDVSVGSRQVIVAVIDTGADIWHNDLRDNVWQNFFEIPDNGLDDDNNGYVDDARGWNFIEDNNDVRTSVFETNGDPKAIHHGTLIAGLIGAVGDNQRSGVGINWRVQIMPLRAVNSQGEGSVKDVAEAIAYAVNNGASVIALSLISDKNNGYLKDALRWAYDKGVVIVAAAGNEKVAGLGDLDTHPLYPICFDAADDENWIIGVSAVNLSDRLSYFANFGKCVDILSPGEDIFSSERYAPMFNFKREFGGPWKGTSFSAPIVAGAAALIKSARPDWGAREIIDNLLNNADNIDEKNPIFAGRLGRGRLNIGRAIKAAGQAPLPALDYLYFAEAGDLYRYNLKEKFIELIARVREADIVSLYPFDIDGNGRPEVALLLKRGQYYYARLMVLGGATWREFALGGDVLSGRALARKIKMFADADGAARIIIEQFDVKRKTAQFARYGMDGALLGAAVVNFQALAWDALPNGGLFVVGADKKGLFMQEISAQNKMVRRRAIKGAGAVAYDIKAAGAVDSPTVFVLARLGGELRKWKIDWESGKVSFEKITAVKNKAEWRLLAGDLNKDGILDVWRFPLRQGGIFPAYDINGYLVRHIRIPAIVGIVD